MNVVDGGSFVLDGRIFVLVATKERFRVLCAVNGCVKTSSAVRGTFLHGERRDDLGYLCRGRCGFVVRFVIVVAFTVTELLRSWSSCLNECN